MCGGQAASAVIPQFTDHPNVTVSGEVPKDLGLQRKEESWVWHNENTHTNRHL